MASLKQAFAPRLLIFLPSANEVQRFVLEPTFRRLEGEFAITYVLPEADRGKYDGAIREINPDVDLRYVAIDPKRFKAWTRLFKAGCYRYADRSHSFAIRVDRRYSGKDGRRNLRRDRASVLAGGGGTGRLRALAARAAFKLTGRSPTVQNAAQSLVSADRRKMFDPARYEALKTETFHKIGPHAELSALIDAVDPVLVIVPTSLMDTFCNDVLWLCETKGIASFIIQSGWDNLSSKGLIFHQPDFTGVWGPQSRSHAIDIQGVPSGRTVLLGAPHYEALKPSPEARANLRRKLAIADDRKLLLFGGSFRQFDETSALRLLESEIKRRKLNVTVLYRPHPYRLDRAEESNFFEHEWKHVVFDPEMQERYQESKKTPGYIKKERPLYSMAYLSTVLSAVDGVISPMSTLLIESLIMGQPTLAIAFSDEHHDYSAGVAAEMTHFEPLKRSKALIWCDASQRFMPDVERLLRQVDQGRPEADVAMLLSQVVTREPGTYADRLTGFVRDQVLPKVLKRSNDAANSGKRSISHHYGADGIAKIYVGLDPMSSEQVPDYWMHGWLSPSFNRVPELVALHKAGREGTRDRLRALNLERETKWQWVARADQVACLNQAGYRKVEAIGLPFAYLPNIDVERRPGSLLVMPPHGMKKFYDRELADRYAAEIAAIRSDFSEVVVCLTERDYFRGEWRPEFQARGIPVIIGSDHRQPNTLLRIKRLLSSFEFVTCNGFGSQIAYAAHCGAKVSLYGSFVNWNRHRQTHAVRMFPHVGCVLEEVQSEADMRREMPFLFRHPAEADELVEWGDEQIGMPWRRSPDELAELFGWQDRVEASDVSETTLTAAPAERPHQNRGGATYSDRGQAETIEGNIDQTSKRKIQAVVTYDERGVAALRYAVEDGEAAGTVPQVYRSGLKEGKFHLKRLGGGDGEQGYALVRFATGESGIEKIVPLKKDGDEIDLAAGQIFVAVSRGGKQYLVAETDRQLSDTSIAKELRVADVISDERGLVSQLSVRDVEPKQAFDWYAARKKADRIIFDAAAFPGYFLSGVKDKDDILDEWNAPFDEIAGRLRTTGRTMLDFDRLYTIWQVVRNLRGSAGSMLEIGVLRGGTSALLAEAARHFGKSGTIYSCDTFAGHAETSEIDGTHTVGKFGDRTSFQDVRNYLGVYPEVQVLEGDIKQTVSQIPEEEIAILHLDVDVYETTRFALKTFAPRLVRGGTIIADDYGVKTCQGVKVAVDTFVEENPGFSILHLLTGQALVTRVS